MQSDTVISQSPSFDTYSSSNRLALIAARVVQEFQPSSDLDDYRFHQQTQNPREEEELKKIDDYEDDDEEFEFASVSREHDLSPISADEIIYNGQIRPSYPLFNTKLLFDDDEIDRKSNSVTPTSSPVRLPLRKLFNEERERDSPSCSSSEADELDRVPAEMYCVWKPKTSEQSPESCKKSNSTGTSRRWKFRDLLYRSNSEGKDRFVFLASPNRKREIGNIKKSGKEGVKISGKVNAVAGEAEFRVRNETVKEDETVVRPYKKDIFGNVNRVSRNVRPF